MSFLKIDVSELRAHQLKSLPSPSAHIDEKRTFTMDKLLPKVKDENGMTSPSVTKSRHVKTAPAVALHN
jgi:hypothetical protein